MSTLNELWFQAAAALGVDVTGKTLNEVMILALQAIIAGEGGAPLNSPAFTGIPTAPTAAPGTSTTQIATTAFTNNAVGLASQGLSQHINGNLNVWQLGTGAVTAAGYTNADMWTQAIGSGETVSTQQVAIVPGSRGSLYPSWLQFALGFNRSVAGSAASYLSAKYDGAGALAGSTFTISDLVNITTAAKSFTLDVTVYQSFGTGGSPTAAITTTTAGVAVVTGTQRTSITVTVPPLTGSETYGSDGNDQTQIWFTLPTGAGVVAGDITGHQIDKGTQALPLRYSDPSVDLTRCQRTLGLAQHSFSNDATPVEVDTANYVTMRDTPSVNVFSTLGGSPSTLTVDTISPISYRAVLSTFSSNWNGYLLRDARLPA